MYIDESINMDKEDELKQKEDRIQKILEKIKKGISIDIFEQNRINLNDLLTVDENNVTYLEYACKNNISLSSNVIKEIYQNKKALYIIIKEGNGHAR